MAQPFFWDAHFRHARQAEYLEKLKRLSPEDADAFRLLFNEIADKKTLTPFVTALLENRDEGSGFYRLAQELTVLVEELLTAREKQDHLFINSLLICLDDVNIAVNAWMNKICLPRSRFLYEKQQKLREVARETIHN
ncbi:MAG TPA: hypothetical protein V6C99_11860 [Oculatellaceae cyanobacterium]